MPLLPFVAGSYGDQFNTSTDQRAHPLGSVMHLADGRRYKYGRATATEIATARLCQQTLNSANFDELVVPTARLAGVSQVTVTTGATACAADLLADGYLNVEDDAGEGYLYTIAGNDAAATTATLTIRLRETLQVAWTTDTTVLIYVNPYAQIIVHPSPATAMLVGATNRVIPASNYGWWQTWGPCSIVTQGTVIINERVIDSATADGAVAPTASTAAGEEFYVGVVMEVAATTEESLISLQIA